MRKFILAAIIAAFLALLNGAKADAAFAVRYSLTGTGGPFTVINDATGGVPAGGDQNGNADIISIDLTGIGTITVGSASGSVSEGTVTTFMLVSLEAIFNGATGAGGFVFDVSRTDIDTAPSPVTLSFNYTGSITPAIGTPPGSTLQMQTWLDDTNAPFGLTPPTTNLLAVPASGTLDGGTVAAPFSATTRILVTLTGAASVSSDANISITGVPGPSALVLALAALPGAGVMYLRRRKQA